MSGYIITEDFIELKRLYEEGNIGKFENKISSYTADDLREFAAYFSLDISSKDEYYNVKIISEITYNLILKEKFTKNDRFIILALKHWGRCVYLSCEKGLWRDVIKYGNLIYEYTLDNDEKWDIQDYLSQAYFYQGNYEKELFYRKRILDQNDYLSLYNYALALFHNQRYEEAKLYNQLCIEQNEFPPAFRNQAHISIVLENDYVKAYDFCDKALEVYYKKEKDFPKVYPIIYLLQQIFICGLCSNYELYKRLMIRKEEFEDGIKSNNKLAENIHMVRFIETCSLTNRAIFYFENVEFLDSINLFHKAEKNIDAEMKIIDEKVILNTYYGKIKEVVSLYILFIQIINSLKNIFSDNIMIERIEEKIEKLNKIRFILYIREDDDFTYEYKKLILLYVEYLYAILNHIFNDNGNADGINFNIEKICLNKTNYVKSNLLNCLFELKQIEESYEENKGLQIFDNDYKKIYINKLKEASYNFCINMKKVNLSFNVYNDKKCWQSSVIDIYGDLYCRLGGQDFWRLFPVILTDNGSEFSNPKCIENGPDGKGFQRTRIYYCNPSAPCQKAEIEVGHEFIQRIVPKGKSFDELTQADIDRMMDHINSYRRKKLNGKSPYEAFCFYYGEELAQKLGCHGVDATTINLTPGLLRK